MLFLGIGKILTMLCERMDKVPTSRIETRMPLITYSIHSLCIDQLEEFNQQRAGEHMEKSAFGHFKILFLIYANNVVLNWDCDKHSSYFLWACILKINVARTKVMIVHTIKCESQNPGVYHEEVALDMVHTQQMGDNIWN